MDNPSKSYEVRWFFIGSIPENVNQWFKNKKCLGDALTDKDGKKRKDLYLVTKGETKISPKLRGGKFEIKYRGNYEELIGPDGKPIGKVETWLKWEWRYAKIKKNGEFEKKFDELVVTSFMEKTSEKHRVKVWKNRWQRKFEISNSGEVAPVPKTKKYIESGLKAELAELKVNAGQWWTLACEIVGAPDNPIDKLKEGLNWLIKEGEYPGPTFRLDNSYSYPEWISTFE